MNRKQNDFDNPGEVPETHPKFRLRQKHVRGQRRDTHTADKMLTHQQTLLFYRYTVRSDSEICAFSGPRLDVFNFRQRPCFQLLSRLLKVFFLHVLKAANDSHKRGIGMAFFLRTMTRCRKPAYKTA